MIKVSELRRASEIGAVSASRADDIARVGDRVSRLLRSFSRATSQFLATAEHDVEWSAHMLISHLVIDGPMRLTALAESVRSDPSTVSRQVAALVQDGLLERRPDPVDGRASLLVATDMGRSVHAEHLVIRDRHYRRMLADWSDQDCRQLATLVHRFTEDFDRYRPRFFAPDDQPQAPRQETT